MTTLKLILDGYKDDLQKVARKSCAEISKRVKDRTPVLSGDLRASWVTDPPAHALQIGDTYRMGTDSPYGTYIEYLAPPARNHPITKYRDAGQPYGMMRRSIAEWQQIVDEAAHGG